MRACRHGRCIQLQASLPPGSRVRSGIHVFCGKRCRGRQRKGTDDVGSALCGGSEGALLRLLAEEEHELPQLGCSRGIRLAGSDAPLQQASPPRAEPLGC